MYRNRNFLQWEKQIYFLFLLLTTGQNGTERPCRARKIRPVDISNSDLWTVWILQLGFDYKELGKFEIIDNCSSGLTVNYITNNSEPECVMKCLSLAEECTAFSFNAFTKVCRASSCRISEGKFNKNATAFYYRKFLNIIIITKNGNLLRSKVEFILTV